MAVSAANRFSYVYAHFRQAYHVPEQVQVHYGAGTDQPGVCIRETGSRFFAGQQPLPEGPFAWHEVAGLRIPFPFDAQAHPQALELQPGWAVVCYDIISAAFFFLSGWQEYYSTAKDHYGRFPYKESLQFRHGFVTVPVVNYYFLLLRQAIRHVYGLELQPRLVPEGQLVFNLTHDIDNLESAWKIASLAELRAGRWWSPFQLLARKLRGCDAWCNLEQIREREQQLGLEATYFFLCARGKHQGQPNADYDVRLPRYQELVRHLAASGAEVAVHGSFGTSTRAAQLEAELQKLPLSVTGNRFHYLFFDPRQTPRVLAEAGLTYDATLGFAEHFGFRHGYCFPFRLFNFETGQPFPVLEIPLALMDVTLHHPAYLQHTPASAPAALAPLVAEVARFGGVLSVLWHNEQYSDFKYRGWGPVLYQLADMAIARGGVSWSCQTLAGHWLEKKEVPV